MRYLLIVLIFSFLVQSCDDGDIITVELDFEETLSLCEDNVESYLFYNVKDNPDESLSLVFPRSGNDDIFEPTVSPSSKTLQINGSTERFNYRTYNQEPSFCNIIDDPNTVVLEDFEASAGTAEFTTVFADNDNDGILATDEGFNTIDPSMSTDTDADGIADYIDQDDDNDNIPTRDEDDNEDGDNNPFTNPRDTDNDGTPDYLDNDDDNDGTLTRFEDENGDGPQNGDIVDINDPNSLPRYRDVSVSDAFEGAPLLNNSFTRVRDITVKILNAGLEIISATEIPLGTYTKEIQNPE
ncbi:hypothetical protein Q2T40_11925 [Winogradskyella maritima]|uniref:Thrombospondin type 3 repeat-containing protein n=1 Tax=Winogradskyella maritima TaxID=1517766 RepID=A0ABV8AHG5_9FLAO|nr:hypothetical protein [Winogradskyella maritima]